MKYQALLDQTKEIRGYLLGSTKGMSDEQLLFVPEGFNNNILWNLGHALTDTCSMLYPPTGHEFPLPDNYLRWFAPGTSPADWVETPSHADILEAGADLHDQLVADCVAGRMENYESLNLDDGVVLENIAYAIAHCNMHEAFHLGIMVAIRKLF